MYTDDRNLIPVEQKGSEDQKNVKITY